MLHTQDISMTRAIACLVLSLALGCGQKTATGPDRSREGVSQHGSEIVLTGPKGETGRVAEGDGNVSLPEGFPKEISIYPGARINTSAKTPEAMTVLLSTADPVTKVADYYEQQCKANGWSIQTTLNSAETRILSASKGKTTCTLNVSQNDGQTTVAIVITSKD